MRVLGISCDFHDAAAAIVVDGEIIAASEQERHSRLKHDPALPVAAIASCLSIAGMRADDLDRVVLHEKPLSTLARILAARQHRGPRSLGATVHQLPTFLRHNLMIGLRVERALRSLGATRRPSLRYADHHLSHAAAAYYPSPFDAAAVLTVDGIGEWATASIGRGIGPHLEVLEELRYPNSLGLLYSMVTDYCGFEPNDGEYKVMGLAPFGEPTHMDALRRLVEVHEDGSIDIDVEAVQDWAAGAAPLESLLGRPAAPRGAAPGRFEADLACSMQRLTEDVVLAMARHAQQITGERRICLAGGVALNCVVNSRLLQAGLFDEVWVQPAAGDAGSAIGAALWLSHSVERLPRAAPHGRDRMRGAMLGAAVDPDAVAAWLDTAAVPYRRFSDRAELAREAAAAIDRSEVVGWFEGRMEFGPRALGHRSILADPRDPEMQSRLNLAIKGRESFRPFAPAVLREAASEWFELEVESPYMLLTAQVAERHRGAHPVGGGGPLLAEPTTRSDLPACTHVDGSARVQTVDPDREDGFRLLVEAFEALTGCPALLNTSFNRAGEPIVCSPDDAVRTARAASLDVLVIEDCMLSVADLPAEMPEGDWQELPDGDATASPNGLLTAAAAAAAAAVGPVARVAAAHGPVAAAATALSLAAVLAVLWAAGHRWLLRAAVVVGTAGVAVGLGGWTLGLWITAGLVATDAVAFGHRPMPWLPPGHQEALGSLVAIGITGAVIGRSPDSPGRVLLLVVGMAVVTVLSMFFPGRLRAASDRIGRGAAGIVSAIATWALGLVVIGLPWVWHRMLGTDPLGPRASSGSTWHVRRTRDDRPTDLWSRGDPRPRSLSAASPARAALALGVLVLASGAAVWAAVSIGAPAGDADPAHSNTDPASVPAAFDGAAWYPEYQQDIAWLWQTSVAWDPLAPVRLRDVQTRHINVVDGARRTWRPPDCSCDRIRVWLYGGSTAFGLGQRDEHTIASEMARAAWEQGIALDIDNRGVVGDHHWEEANRFAWDLATLPAPDLVLFLDGINDVQAVDRLRERSRQPVSFVKDDFWQNYLATAEGSIDPRWAPAGDAEGGEPPPGAAEAPQVPLTLDDATAVGQYVAERYETARRISAASARDAGVAIAWFWQPAIENRPAIDGEPPPNGREWSLERYRAAIAAVGPEVRDISVALDGVEEPVYWDQFHTNERGAAVIGRAMFAEVEPLIEELTDTREEPR